MTKKFIDNQQVMLSQFQHFSNSLIVNKKSFYIIWPVTQIAVSLYGPTGSRASNTKKI